MTEDTTEIVATFPIYKPFRRVNYQFKGKLRKQLQMMQPNFLAKRLPHFLGRFIGQKYQPVVEELNQFVYLSMESDEERYERVKNREKVERAINKHYVKIASQTLKEIANQVKQDPEFIASFKAIKDISSHPEVEISSELSDLKKLATSVRDQIQSLFMNSQMILWDLPGDQIDRIIIGDEVISIDEYGSFDIISIADEMALVALAKHHVPLVTKKITVIHEALNALSGQISTFQNGINGFRDEKEKRLLIEVASVFLGKLLGIREPIQLAQKQLERYLQLKDDINEEVENTGSDFVASVYADHITEADITRSLQLSEEIMDILGENSEKIRKTYNIIESSKVTGTSPPVIEKFSAYVAGLYHDLEDFRFITETLQDIPSFTSMGGGVAVSSASETLEFQPTKNQVIFAENIFKTFPLATTTVYALRGIDIEINQGEFVAIMGPSGSGKTTLLNILSGIEEPDRGQIWVSGLNLGEASEKELVKFRRDTIAFIYQSYNLLPNLTNQENVQLPADLGTKKDIGKKSNRSEQLLDEVGLKDYIKGFPLRLSGGQQQRVTIARSLMNRPDVIFADEPTGDLDTITGGQILNVLESFHSEGVTIVVVTHDQNVADRADRVLHMRDGKMIDADQAAM